MSDVHRVPAKTHLRRTEGFETSVEAKHDVCLSKIRSSLVACRRSCSR